MTTDFSFVYTTFSNADDANSMARELVNLHLAACCNIIPKVTSVYKWEGEVVTEDEVVMLIKTGLDKYQKCKEYLENTHPMDTPVIAKVAIDDINQPYAQWLTMHLIDRL